MKRVAIVLIVIILCSTVAGCVSTQNNNSTKSEPTESANHATEKPISNAKTGTEAIVEAYEQFTDIKTKYLTKLTDAITYDTNAAFGILSLLSLISVDMNLTPVTLLGKDGPSVAITMAFLRATDMKFSGSGNNYSISYLYKDGTPCLMNIIYDAGSDAMVCTSEKDGEETIYMQYQKTSFGYIAQYYLTSEKRDTKLYRLSLSGEDGVVGISNDVDRPAALTGSESADFPKTDPEWYAMAGSTVTGLTSDGKDLLFEYTPTPAQ